MLNRLYLVRHARSVFNERRIYNSNPSDDLGLSDYGLKQAKRIADYFREKKIDAILSSPFKRTIQTAEAISVTTGSHIVIEDAFREAKSGLWEGKTESEIKKTFPVEWAMWKADPFNYPIPGGESVSDIYDRVAPAFDRISEKYSGKTVVLVTHYFVFNTLLCGLMGDLTKVRFFDTANGTVAEVTFGKIPRLESFVRID